jgi:hypothetical protein
MSTLAAARVEVGKVRRICDTNVMSEERAKEGRKDEMNARWNEMNIDV